MYKHLALALLLTLNHSLLFGVMEAAHLPDADHPLGQIYTHDHAPHADDTDTVEHHDHHVLPQAASATSDSHHADHHHGVHVHLNCDLPESFDLAYVRPASERPWTCLSLLPGRTYSPPVPPPDR